MTLGLLSEPDVSLSRFRKRCFTGSSAQPWSLTIAPSEDRPVFRSERQAYSTAGASHHMLCLLRDAGNLPKHAKRNLAFEVLECRSPVHLELLIRLRGFKPCILGALNVCFIPTIFATRPPVTSSLTEVPRGTDGLSVLSHSKLRHSCVALKTFSPTPAALLAPDSSYPRWLNPRSSDILSWNRDLISQASQ